jgi:hypothetical protein
MTGDVCLKQNILYLTQIRSGLALHKPNDFNKKPRSIFV